MAAALAAIVLPAPALAGGGGATPGGSTSSASGGTAYGQPVAERAPRPGGRKRRGRPVLKSFRLSRSRLYLYGRPASVSFRIDGRARSVRVRLAVVRPGARRPVARIALGERPTGTNQSYRLTGREAGLLPQGRYVVRIGARDARGRTLRRPRSTKSAAKLRVLHHRFPLLGRFSYGGAGGEFGAPRGGRRHQGQDLSAAEGTPIVATRGGVVEVVAYQAGGAGHYVVLDGQREDRDYVFMHMRTGSVRVRRGQRVRTGQRIGDVGNTGRSFGAHLHFEVWVGGWYAGGRPVDPLPLLRRWDRWS